MLVVLLVDELLTRNSGGLQTLPMPQLDGCSTRHGERLLRWSSIQGYDQQLRMDYACEGVSVSIEISRFVEQRQGKEAITQKNSVINGGIAAGLFLQDRAVRGCLSVSEYRIDHGGQRGTLWSWYSVGGKPSSTPVVAKLIELRDAVFLRRNETAIISVVAWTDDKTKANKALERAVSRTWQWYLDQLNY
ncbi:MAG: EpsI family protein [Roseibium album]|uniref:exosortase C-terminal domain/associated protein EpsI n=1 Tax=Roseibium album TaxID=311410 RepID=UPI0032EDAFEC